MGSVTATRVRDSVRTDGTVHVFINLSTSLFARTEPYSYISQNQSGFKTGVTRNYLPPTIDLTCIRFGAIQANLVKSTDMLGSDFPTIRTLTSTFFPILVASLHGIAPMTE